MVGHTKNKESKIEKTINTNKHFAIKKYIYDRRLFAALFIWPIYWCYFVCVGNLFFDIYISHVQNSNEVDSNKVEEENEDSNKIAERKEVVEETSPIKEVKKENKEAVEEEKEKDTAEDGGEEGEQMETEEVKEMAVASGPRALHKTFSLFMRSVPPNISKADIAAVSILQQW